MPSVTSAEFPRLGDVRESLGRADENATEEFSDRLGIGRTPATEPQERATLTSLPPEVQQQILSHAGDGGIPVQSFLNVRSLRLTDRSLENAFLGDRSLTRQYTDNWEKARLNIAIRDIENEGGQDGGAPEADDIIARHRVTDPVDQREIRKAGALRDINGALRDIKGRRLAADELIARHGVTNIVDQGVIRKDAANKDIKDSFLPADRAIARHKIVNLQVQDELRLNAAKLDVDEGHTSAGAIFRQGIEKQEAKDDVLRARVAFTHPGGSPPLTKEEVEELGELVGRELSKSESATLDDVRRSLKLPIEDFEKLVPQYFKHESDSD